METTSHTLLATLPDGTNYVQETVLDATAKRLQVTTTNSNYQKIGGQWRPVATTTVSVVVGPNLQHGSQQWQHWDGTAKRQYNSRPGLEGKIGKVKRLKLELPAFVSLLHTSLEAEENEKLGFPGI